MIEIIVLVLGYISFENILQSTGVSIRILLDVWMIFNFYLFCKYKINVDNIKNIAKINLLYCLLVALKLKNIETILQTKNQIMQILKGFFLENSIYSLATCIIIISVLVMLVKGVIATQEISSRNSNNKENLELYFSRVETKDLLNFYLDRYNYISLVGDWGIGKSYFIKYFFQRKLNSYGESIYETIIIDVASYSTNNEILKKINLELGKIFKKNKIFIFKIDVFKEIIIENNIFDKIKNIIFDLIDETIESGIKRLKNKSIVICLDNIERINEKDRIIKLLSAIDEQLVSKVEFNKEKLKIIYAYDEEHMKLLFKNENINFINYISKYSEARIPMRKISISDLENNEKNEKLKEILEDLSKKIEEKRKEIKKGEIDKKIDMMISLITDRELDTIEKTKKIQEIKQRINNKYFEKLDIIDRKIANPRFIEQTRKMRRENESLLLTFKYKILLVVFEELSLDILERNGDIIDNITFNFKNLEEILTKKNIELIVFNDFFFENDIRDSVNQFKRMGLN